MNNLVSIITPSYNSEKFISETIESVLSQTYQNWEILIVDDVSPDNANEIIEEYIKKDSRIKLDKNSGAAVARNMAIEEAKGRFIAFLDADDIWEKDKLEKQIKFMIKNDYAFTYTAYEKVDENGNFLENMGIPEKLNYQTLLKANIIGCLTVMYDIEKLGKIYMPTNTKREDFATWLNILKKINFAYGITDSLAQYRVYASQSSGKKINMAKENWKLYREVERLSLIQASYYFTNYAVRGILRAKFPEIARLLGILH